MADFVDWLTQLHELAIANPTGAAVQLVVKVPHDLGREIMRSLPSELRTAPGAGPTKKTYSDSYGPDWWSVNRFNVFGGEVVIEWPENREHPTLKTD
jgi:hypothetical protein